MGTLDEEQVMFSFLLRRDQKESLTRIAKERQTNVATLVREAVREFLGANGAGRPSEPVAA